MFDSDGISDGVSCEIYALDAHSIVHEQGLAWRALLPEPFGQGDTLGSAAASNLILFEDDRRLGPPHAQHETIRRTGGGAYSHWNGHLYFSSSDRSDPTRNGRSYRLALGAADASLYPIEIYLETINTCNARCPFCPLFQGDSKLDRMLRPATIMTWQVFEKCAREIASWPRLPATIYPHANGEPLQDPQFARRLELLANLGLGRLLNLHTNAQFLSEAMARAILTAGVRTISVAFDGATKEVYEAHRVRCDYQRVLKNIERFVRIRNEMSERTQLVIVYVRTRDNEHEVAAAYEMFSRILDPELDEFHDKLSSDWADETQEGDYFRLPKAKGKKVEGCSALENQLVISADGTLAACCIDYNLSISEGGFGNAGQDSLIELWRGQKRAGLRDRLISGFDEALPRKCRDCPSLLIEPKLDASLAKIDKEAVTAGSYALVYRFQRREAKV